MTNSEMASYALDQIDQARLVCKRRSPDERPCSRI